MSPDRSSPNGEPIALAAPGKSKEDLLSTRPSPAYPASSVVPVAPGPQDAQGTTPSASATFHFGPLPTLFGSYELLEEVAHGGMGVVYKARDLNLGRTIALKMLRGGAFPHPEDLQRFQREARAAAKLQHPNIVPIHEISQYQSYAYYTMAFVARGNLYQHMAEYRDPRAAARLMAKVAAAVHYAHEQGILHRDMKPGNILIDERGDPLVADFGLAKFLASDANLTRSGDMVGTPAYMAPEQAAGQTSRISGQSDVWALGVILYELLTGTRPFQAETTEAIYEHIRDDEPRRPRKLRPDLPRDLETIILKCLEKEPGRRYATAGEVGEELGRWMRGDPILAKRWIVIRRAKRAIQEHWLGCSAAALVAAAGLAWTATDYYSPTNTNLRDLSAGREVMLIGASGSPRDKVWCCGDGGFQESGREYPGFLVHTFNEGLLQLMPKTAVENYRLKAEIRHIKGAGPSQVGVFFGYHKWETKKGIEHWCVRLSFADLGDLNGFYSKNNLAENGRCNRVTIKLCRYGNSALITGTEGESQIRAFEYPSVKIDPGSPSGPWRNVSIDVARNHIQIQWEGRQIAAFSTKDLVQRAYSMLNDAASPRRQNPEIPAETAIDIEGGIGVYCCQGSALFRNVRVQVLR